MARKGAPDVETVIDRLTTRQFLDLEPALIREVLKRLEREAGFSALFVREVMRDVPETKLKAQWALALNAVSKAGRQYSIGDAAFRETLRLLQDPVLLGACQATAVQCGAPVVVCAALAKDGSEASFDALMAELERARDGRDDWALRYKLNRLHRYAKPGPAFEAFQGAVDAAMNRRDAKKAESSYAKKLGLHVPLLELSVWLVPVKGPGKFAWVSVSDRHESFSLQTTDDRPKVTDIKKVPAWLAKLGVKWDWAGARVRTNLRGKHRTAMLEWLEGKRRSPVA